MKRTRKNNKKKQKRKLFGKSNKNRKNHKKNPAYGRQRISRPERIVAPIPTKFPNLRPVLYITFPQGFQKSTKFGH